MWYSVNDKLPNLSSLFSSDYVLCVLKSGTPVIAKFGRSHPSDIQDWCCFTDDEYDVSKQVTHWMYIPEFKE